MLLLFFVLNDFGVSEFLYLPKMLLIMGNIPFHYIIFIGNSCFLLFPLDYCASFKYRVIPLRRMNLFIFYEYIVVDQY